MEYLIGALATTALFLCVYGGYKLDTRSKPIEEKTEQDYEAEQLMKDFNETMSYNLKKALEHRN